MALGRPITIDVQDLYDKFEKYLSENEIPIIKKFTSSYPISYTYFYKLADDNPELKDTIKRAIEKKEAGLEDGALNNKVNVSMAIFSLKQLGWKDKSEIEQTIVDKTKMAKELENTFE